MTVVSKHCVLKLQGFEPCGCVTWSNGVAEIPCRAGLKVVDGEIHRLIYEVVLSRPEDYLSIYQSGCNHNCLKCHSWYFAQHANGSWYSPGDVLREVLRYREQVTVTEPRERATMWHASDLCAHCGSCKVYGEPGPLCPRRLSSDKIVWSPQGWGPARNIVSFTGGDLYCRPEFYVKTFRLIKREAPELWIHIETNGYGLTPRNLELLYEAGLDSIWLDMKAYDEDIYRMLCGTTNRWVLEVPELARELGIVIEIVLLYIPTLVEHDQIEKFAAKIAEVDKRIPVMLLAFFPEYKLKHLRPPTLEEMIRAYRVLRSKLENVRIGNIGVFCSDSSCIERLIKEVGRENLAF